MEITINVKVTGLDRLAAAIESLVSFNPNSQAPQTTTPVAAPATLTVVQPVQSVHTQPIQPIQPVQTQPVTAAAIPTQMAPTTQMTQGATALAPNSVPTTAPTYSMDQLAVAATQLMDAGRQQDLVSLLGSFGVQALTQLPKEMYGEFATRLRGMGAKI